RSPPRDGAVGKPPGGGGSASPLDDLGLDLGRLLLRFRRRRRSTRSPSLLAKRDAVPARLVGLTHPGRDRCLQVLLGRRGVSLWGGLVVRCVGGVEGGA